MTKAEQLAEDKAKKEYAPGMSRGATYSHSALQTHRQSAYIKGYMERDQTAKSDMVKFAEWCSKNYILRIRGTWHTHGNHCQDLTTTDLLKIFNQLNKGE